MSELTYLENTYLSHDEVLEEMAYMLSIAPPRFAHANIRSDILKLKKKYVIDTISGSYIKYMKRNLSSDKIFLDILSVLKAADKTEDIRMTIKSSILIMMAIEFISKFGPDNPDISDSDEGIIFLSIWAPFIAYIREEDGKFGEVAKALPKGDILYASLEHFRNGSELFFTFTDGTLDGNLMNNITGSYYAYCKKELPGLLNEARYLRCTTTSMAAFYKNNHIFAGADIDWNDLEASEKSFTDRERRSSVLSPDYDKNVVGVSETEWTRFYITKALQEEVDLLALNGIDIDGVLATSTFTSKDISDIIKQGFVYSSKRTGMTDFSKRRDQAVVIKMIIKLWIYSAVGKRYEELVKAAKSKGKPMNADAKKLVERLKKENESLKNKKPDVAKEVDRAVRSKNQTIKSLQAEIASLRSEIKAKDSLIEDLEAEIEDVKNICEDLDTSEEENITEEYSDEFFRSYIQDHKVIVWGLRDDVRSRFEKMYPELVYVESDRTLTRQQLSNCDAFIMYTSFTNHAKYWAARDTVKNAGIPIVQMRKDSCHPSKLVKALDTALGRE